MKYLLLIIGIALMLVAAYPETQIKTDGASLPISQFSQLAGVKAMRCGSITVIDLPNTPIAFQTPIPSTNYETFFQPHSAVTATFWPVSNTVNGVTIALNFATPATFSYLCVER